MQKGKFMSYAIRHLFHIAAPGEKVYEALSTIEGLSKWWTVNTRGDTSRGGVIHFRFGSYGGPDFKVLESVPGKKVKWACIANDHEWLGHTFSFDLDRNDGKTRIRFSHDGWEAQDDFHASCCFTWARYLESLRQYCQTGKGEAFGSEGYR